jgi:hypothetical protein
VAERITGKEAAEALASFCNDYGADHVGFMLEIQKTHRTLQQGIGRIMVSLISQWASDYGYRNYDGRNEAVCELAHQIMAKVDPKYMQLPLI